MTFEAESDDFALLFSEVEQALKHDHDGWDWEPIETGEGAYDPEYVKGWLRALVLCCNEQADRIADLTDKLTMSQIEVARIRDMVCFHCHHSTDHQGRGEWCHLHGMSCAQIGGYCGSFKR